MKHDFFLKKAHKVFLINTNLQRQIQVYWFKIKTKVKFAAELKVRLTLGY